MISSRGLCGFILLFLLTLTVVQTERYFGY